jgi:hypothetical protein
LLQVQEQPHKQAHKAGKFLQQKVPMAQLVQRELLAQPVQQVLKVESVKQVRLELQARLVHRVYQLQAQLVHRVALAKLDQRVQLVRQDHKVYQLLVQLDHKVY